MNALQTNPVDLNQVVALTLEQAKARYNLGSGKVYEIADEAQANIRIGKKRLYSRIRLDDYFENELIDY
mgnify:CR=1 FL=1